jgi:hypothetical protein
LADITALQIAAYPNGQLGPVEALDALWRAVFALEAWVFLVHPGRLARGDDPFPFIADVGGEGCLMIFTSTDEAAAFAGRNKLATPDGAAATLNMPTAAALQWLDAELPASVARVAFNHGPNGWFAPRAQVGVIHRALS